MQIRIFISAVSIEFGDYREALRHALTRSNVHVAIQEDFIATGGQTLLKLDDYIQACDAVIHLVGDACGADAHQLDLQAIVQRYPDLGKSIPSLLPHLQEGSSPLPYTQWEAWLAIHHGKDLFVAVPAAEAPRGQDHVRDDNQVSRQLKHLDVLKRDRNVHPGVDFTSQDHLTTHALKSSILELLSKAPATAPPQENWGAQRSIPLPPQPSVFVGRADELLAMQEALLPANRGLAEATVVCCAIEGMPGVGKTRLAEQFIREHWLPAMGAPDAAIETQERYLVRIVLDAQTIAAPDPFKLGQQVADLIGSSGPPSTLWTRLQAALRPGPNGRLLLIENVDTRPLAGAVGAFVNQLPGCAILMTARFQKLGQSQGWKRVAVPQLPLEQAIELLLAETEQVAGTHLTKQEAEHLATTLGCLPLALHIAASHITSGTTAEAFLRELQHTGLTIEHTDPADWQLTTDRARAILKSSFDISWQHWCTRSDINPVWPMALASLAHGPAASVGLKLGAAITGLVDEHAVSLFAAKAAQLSLLEYRHQRLQLHPLIAEFLRGKQESGSERILIQMTNWFFARLKETTGRAQGARWSEIRSEFAALTHWLSRLQLHKPETQLVRVLGDDFSINIGPFGAWQAFYTGLLQHTEMPQARSRTLFLLAWTARLAGDLNAAMDAAKSMREVDRARGADRDEAIASGLIADLTEDLGDLDEAQRIRYEEQLPIYKRIGELREISLTFSRIAFTMYQRGETDKAMQILREKALPICEQIGEERGTAVVWNQIADIYQERSRHGKALDIRKNKVLPVFRKLQLIREEAVTLGKIATSLYICGQKSEGLRILLDEVLPVYVTSGDIREQAGTLRAIAEIYQLQGKLNEALALLRQAVGIFAQLSREQGLYLCRWQLASVLAERGHRADHEEMILLLKAAYDGARRLKLPEARNIAADYYHLTGQSII